MKTVNIPVLFLLSVCCPCLAADKNQEQKPWDLELLTAVIPHFNVEKVTASQALVKPFTLVLGGTESDYLASYIQFRDDTGKKVSLSEPSITLNLENAPAYEIISYIAELSSCRWKIWGWPGAPFLLMKRLTEIDDTGLFLHSAAISCSAKAAKSLGLKDGMAPEEVGRILARYGVEFGGENIAIWNSKSKMLGVRNYRGAIGFVQTLVSLSENGWHSVKAAKVN